MAHRSILWVTAKKITMRVKAIYCRRRLLFLLTLALLALPLIALAQGGNTPRPAPVLLTEQQEQYPLGLHLELLKDPTGQLTINDVSSPAYDAQFSPSQAAVPNFGTTPAAIWARFQVRNQAGPAVNWRLAVAEARLEYVDLYAPAGDGTGWAHQQAGRSRPFTLRDVPYRYGVFKLLLPPGQTQTIYLRSQGDGSPILLPLTLWSLEAFTYQSQTELLVFGLFYGVMLVMFGYNLFLFASLRERSYLYLALFIASVSLNDAFREGLAQQYLWPQWPNLYGIGITATLGFIFSLLFGTTFLQTKKRTPRLHRVMVAFVFIVSINYVLFLLGWSLPITGSILPLLLALLLVAAGVITWRQGYRPARYYLLAWLIFLGAGSFHNLINIGVLPGTSFSQQGVRIGTALMVLLLSLALADRINLLKAATEQANEALTEEIQARKITQQALGESEKKYRTVVEQAAEGIMVMQDGRRTYYNPALLEITGYSAEEYDSIPFLALAHKDDLETVEAVYQKLLTEPGFSALPDFRFTDKSGEIKWVSVRGTRIEWEGKPAGMIFIQDITRRKQMEAELRQHRDHLEELVAVRAAELVEANQNLQQQITERRKVEAVLRDVQGQLEQRVAERTAELEQANQQLTTLLDTLEQRVADRTRELTTFLDLTMLVSEVNSLPDILETAIDRVLEVGRCQAVCLHLPGEDQSSLELVVQRGLSYEQQQNLHRLRLAGPLADWLAQRREPVLNFIPTTTTPLPAALYLEGFSSYLGAQLHIRGQREGLLSYYRQSAPHFSLDEISLLAALAEQLGIVIENHRLRSHIEELAVVAERQRLARELHDSITQSLYSLNLFAHAGREAAEDGDATRLDDSLTRVEVIAQTALKEMRLLLYHLQPEVLAEKGLAEALQIRFDLVERRLGIRVDYQVEGQMALPDPVAEALYRAALEALNNALKHAGASQMVVYLSGQAQTVRLEIADNGRGFDPAQVRGGMGLKHLRERLEQVGGDLEIVSAPGAGTRIILAVNGNLPEMT